MIKSMTGYGSGECSRGGTRFTAEIKSVNNRYRDIIIRAPKTLQGIEDELKAYVASRVRRGRIEVTLKMEREGGEEEYAIAINLPLAKSYLRILESLKEDFGLDEKINPLDLCQVRDMILVEPAEVVLDEIRPGLQEVLRLALDSYDAMRIQEGKAIEEDFLDRLEVIEGYLEEIEKKAPLVVEEYRQKLTDKINKLAQGIEVDESRLTQEVAFFAERCDITEETVRARSHLKQFRHYLSMDEAVGRRLDFLMQEINREVNTMSAKASDFSISGNAVEIKGELEKLREQMQNIE